MTARLCDQVNKNFSGASKKDLFFDKAQIRTLNEYEKSEQPQIGGLENGCKTNLYFGFFFDGTRNNYILAEKTSTHSNIARLYDCYPGQSVPGVLPANTDWEYNPPRYTHFFRTYIPGVGTPFQEVNDSGAGATAQMGAASGYLAERRIVWALLQAINHVHRYFLKVPLLLPDEMRMQAAVIRLDQASLQRMAQNSPDRPPSAEAASAERPRLTFQRILRRLHAAVAQHWPDEKTGRPATIDPGIVQKIHLSIFGFSRGATQARAYTNWLMALCRLDAQLCGKEATMTLGGFAVAFDFLGIFDTVASIGTGNTLGNSWIGKMFDGHGGWADAEVSLRVPQNITCVHLVAAHELRRSFPLDSVSVAGDYPSNCAEIVVPGVHSDIGCGYAPGEQRRGKNPDGDDMLARIPLLLMYRAARLAGVPLKLELANASAKKRFKVAPEAINAFNRYIAACATRTGALTAIMREQQNYQMQWRLLRRTHEKASLEASDSYRRASTFDQNDLHSANLEFETEIGKFTAWLDKKGNQFHPARQQPGMENNPDREWEEIALWWRARPLLKPDMATFFDEFVHDSRAWFKLVPGNPDNEADLIVLLKQWDAKRVKAIEDTAARPKRVGRTRSGQMVEIKPDKVDDGLDDSQRTAAQEYARTGKIPAMITTGREPLEGSSSTMYLSARGGYLRYRKIYGGRDSVLLSEADAVTQGGQDLA